MVRLLAGSRAARAIDLPSTPTRPTRLRALVGDLGGTQYHGVQPGGCERSSGNSRLSQLGCRAKAVDDDMQARWRCAEHQHRRCQYPKMNLFLCGLAGPHDVGTDPQRKNSNGEASCSTTTSLRQTVVGNIESELMDEVIPAAASSDLQIRTRAGGQPTEVPPRCRNDVINGSRTSATSVGRARLMMSEFAVAPALSIDNSGRRAIGIALVTAAALHRGCIRDE
ncbi:hypothetical protein THAOC_03591 [Thalassiosira oceanica]|uniref:DUF6820 domain-containing protein n=1 Tax=Thalassiosira oceanica TaxID=159749 RepID=K0TB66_THAOC|nr:hypothetical protein THAOC_03591 [Thalassiosira oceanica]|eukprot:EJK74715.1 hypothetical protein THAOC_03591 [Thalassiosira oceanica]